MTDEQKKAAYLADLIKAFHEKVTTKQVMEDLEIPTDKNICCLFHAESNPSAGYDPTHDKYHCFGPCKENTKDGLDLLEELKGMDIPEACREYGIDVDGIKAKYYGRGAGPSQSYIVKPTAPAGAAVQKKETSTKPDYNHDFSIAGGFLDRIEPLTDQTDYLKNRGLSPETIRKGRVGYCREWLHPKKSANVQPASERVVFPFIGEDGAPTGYLARATGEHVSPKDKSGKMDLYSVENVADYLRDTETPLIVVEGEIDALSIEEVGGHAVALGSTSMWRRIVAACQSTPPALPLIVGMDSDKAGQEARDNIRHGLLGICNTLTVDWGSDDANDLLQRDRQALTRIVQDCRKRAIAMKGQPVLKILPEEAEEYRKGQADKLLDSFLQTIEKPRVSFRTGFPELDRHLGGGIHPREAVYIGAPSSAGKTTFVLQLADNIAKSGIDVLYISLEQDPDELIAKSLSRLSFDIAREGNNRHNGLFSSTIRNKCEKPFNVMQQRIFKESVERYREYAGRIRIEQHTGAVTMKDIRKMVEDYIFFTGSKPVVMIDYVQIVAPEREGTSDKQNVDNTVRDIRAITKELDLAVIGICSFNRGAYNSPASMESFKESGGVEYTSDVLLALQPEYIDLHYKENKDGNMVPEDDKTRSHRIYQARRELEDLPETSPEKISLVILKARNSRRNVHIKFDAYLAFSTFEQAETSADTGEPVQVAEYEDSTEWF